MSVGRAEEKLEDYSEEDRKLLISLLNEYAEKLSNICERLDKSMGEQDLTELNTFLLIVGLTALILLLGTGRVFLYSLPFYNPFSDPYLFSFGIGAMALVIVLSVKNITAIPRNSLKIKNLVRDAKVLAKRLEKVTQIVSQMQEHSANQLSIRIEMDLRLADAEITLEHYEILRRRHTGAEQLVDILKSRLTIFNN